MPLLQRFRAQPAPVIEAADAADGVVRVSLNSLIALNHAAAALQLRPGRIRSLVSGAYHSPFKGRGMEFDEVRPYAVGDDARTLDWRVTARTGRPHTKLYREERERPVLLWLDLGRSMFFATQGAFKAVRAAQAAALLGWCAVQQGDRLGALLAAADSHLEVRPRLGKPGLLHLLRSIAEHPAWHTPPSAIDPAEASLARLRRVAQPGSQIVLLSDFAMLEQDATADVARAHLEQLARHNDLLLVNIHDPLEAELPPPGQYRCGDGVNFVTLSTDDPAQRRRYRTRYATQQDQLAQWARQHRMLLLTLSTAEHPLAALTALAHRSSR